MSHEIIHRCNNWVPVGVGGQACVFAADGQAVKCMSRNDGCWRNEIHSCLVRHPCVIHYTAVIYRTNTVELWMPLYPLDLQTYLQFYTGGAYCDGLNPAINLLQDVLAAVTCLHQVGVMHADIKPSNIMLHRCDGRLRAVLCDLGISRRCGAMGSAVVQTGAWRAPEVPVNGPDRRHYRKTDLWSVGRLGLCLLGAPLPVGGCDSTVPAAQLFQLPTTGRRRDRLAQLRRCAYDDVLAAVRRQLLDCNPAITPAAERVLVGCLQPRRGRRPHATVLQRWLQ